MISINVVKTYLKQNILNIPKRFESEFPNDGFHCPVLCGDLTFMGLGSRKNNNGAVRLTFLMSCANPRNNECYRDFMRVRGVGAELQFEKITGTDGTVERLRLIN
jgi:hypothetical protein